MKFIYARLFFKSSKFNFLFGTWIQKIYLEYHFKCPNITNRNFLQQKLSFIIIDTFIIIDNNETFIIIGLRRSTALKTEKCFFIALNIFFSYKDGLLAV